MSSSDNSSWTSPAPETYGTQSIAIGIGLGIVGILVLILLLLFGYLVHRGKSHAKSIEEEKIQNAGTLRTAHPLYD